MVVSTQSVAEHIMKRKLLTMFVLCATTHFAQAHEGEDHSVPPVKSAAAAVAPALAPAAAGAQRQANGAVFMMKPVQRALGVRTAVAEAGEYAASIELNGRVVADPAQGGRVQAAQGSRVEAPSAGLPRLGQRVVRGQVLATLVHIEDPVERARQQVMVHETSNQLDIAQRRQRRHQDAPGYFPRREVEETRIEIASMERRLTDLKASISGRETLIAPVSGVIASSMVVAGQVVEARELLFEIVDPQRLMIEAQAFDAALVDALGSASATAPDGQPIRLRFVGGGRILRDASLPLLFAIDLSAAGKAVSLALGQPLKLVASTRRKERGVAVPASALVRATSGETQVWVHETAEMFVPRTVTVQPLDAGRRRITAGLVGGERVVTEGASLIGQVR
jgi:hypothetical protein